MRSVILGPSFQDPTIPVWWGTWGCLPEIDLWSCSSKPIIRCKFADNIGCPFEYLDYFFIEMQKNEFKLICVLFSCLIFFCIRTLHQSKRTLMVPPTWLHLHLDQLNPRGPKTLLWWLYWGQLTHQRLHQRREQHLKGQRKRSPPTGKCQLFLFQKIHWDGGRCMQRISLFCQAWQRNTFAYRGPVSHLNGFFQQLETSLALKGAASLLSMSTSSFSSRKITRFLKFRHIFIYFFICQACFCTVLVAELAG